MLAGAVGMFGIALACIKWYRFSSFAGGSGYFLIGLSILGAIGGFFSSIIAVRVIYSFVSTHWRSQLGVSLAIVLAALAIILAYSFSGIDRIPSIDGRSINTVWEIRLPVAGTDKYVPSGDPRDWPSQELRLEPLSVLNNKALGFRTAEFDRDAFRQEDVQWINVARVPLFTGKGEFRANLTLGGRDDDFWPSMRPSHHTEYSQWSAWARTNKGSDNLDDADAAMYRFKFEISRRAFIVLAGNLGLLAMSQIIDRGYLLSQVIAINRFGLKVNRLDFHATETIGRAPLDRITHGKANDRDAEIRKDR